jgi:hypothetical protein
MFLTKSLTNSSGAHFHNAVDGLGPTVVLMEATPQFGSTQIIGGYNPQSWQRPSRTGAGQTIFQELVWSKLIVEGDMQVGIEPGQRGTQAEGST